METALQLVTPPTELAITLAQATLHLRVDGDAENDHITALIHAAAAEVESITHRSLMEQTWKLTLDQWPGVHGSGLYARSLIYLPRPPLISITSVQYVDAAGTLQTLSSELYSSYPDHQWLAAIGPVYGQSWPTARCQPDAIRVTYDAGYEDAAALAAAQPATVAAIKLIVAELYERREEAISGTIIATVPIAARRLLAGQVVHAFGHENG